MPDEVINEVEDAEKLQPAPSTSAKEADEKWEEIMGNTGDESFETLITGEEPKAEEKEEETPTEEPVIEPAAKAAPATDETPEIDPSLVSLAVDLGADKADLDTLIKDDPEQATELLTKLRAEYNSQTLDLLNGKVSAETKPAQEVDPASSDTKESALSKLLTDDTFLAQAKEEHGEAYVNDYLVPMAKQMANLAEREAKLDAVLEQSAAAEQQALIAEINTTFSSFGVGYADFYGADVHKATDEQVANRQQVGAIADQLKSGDIARGNPSGSHAHYVTRAHHIVAADQQKVAARKELISQIKTRSKTLSSKPSGKTGVLASGEKSEDAAKDALGHKASELGLGSYFED